MRTPRARTVTVYLLLIGGGVLFTTPFLWMLSTALKPIEQTMSMPPTWLPRRHHADTLGSARTVIPGERLEQPHVIATVAASGKPEVLHSTRIRDGILLGEDARGRPTRTALTIHKDIPATPDAPWVVVYFEDATGESETGRTGELDAVPVSALTSSVGPRWGNFGNAIHAMGHFWRYLRNTLVLCFLTVVGTVTSSAVAAYGFSRIQWRGRNKVFAIVLATMMIPFPVVMVPIYCLFRALGMIGTLQPLWVGSFFASAFNVFLLRQFFMTIPHELSDAARIDGCNEFEIFLRIIVPLSKPALMVVGLFQFMYTWNDFLGPLIYLTDQKDFTLALGLQFFQSQHGGTQWHYLMAASVLIVTPVIVLFFFTQRSFIEGISMSGLKG